VRFAFTEQQLELRAAVRQVLERECTPDDLRAIAAAGPPAGDPDRLAAGRSAERWAVLARLGAPGLMVPADHGGLGLGEVDLVGVAEEAGWAGLPEPLMETAALAAPLLAEVGALAPAGSPVHKVTAQALPAMATGDLVATVGGMELGTDGFVPTTRSGTSGDAVITVRVGGATRAGLHLLARQVGDGGWDVHAVDHPVRILFTPSIDATRDLGTVEWVPSPATVVASGDQAVTLLGDLADRAALCAAAQLLGLSRRMLAMAADYAKERHQFGKPIGSFQAVKHLLAGARVRLEFAAPATYRAADSLARRLPDRSVHVSMAKALASDAADLAGRVALQVHGAIGYTWECDLHLYMKRAWALSAGWGDAATHRHRVLAAVLDERAS
jgi:alkylation response protein AidB-like acyl-CoA dehydrogenase